MSIAPQKLSHRRSTRPFGLSNSSTMAGASAERRGGVRDISDGTPYKRERVIFQLTVNADIGTRDAEKVSVMTKV